MDPIRVLSVSKVSLQILKSNPPKLFVAAEGEVPTSGWRDGALLAWRYVTTPEDGIQDFDFVATPPEGIVLPMISPIHAEIEGTVDVANYWGPGKPLLGARIHARQNVQEALLADTKSAELQADPVVPWPWLSARTTPKVSEPFIGKTLRVYHTGDALTLDLRTGRLNIELGADEHIVKIWIG